MATPPVIIHTGVEPMPEPPMILEETEIKIIESAISSTEKLGTNIRNIFRDNSNESTHDITWEVEAAVEALDVFASRWTIEILAALYIAGERRFNELRRLLVGISSRTLSDKLTYLREFGFVNRIVVDGPPVKVTYCLTDHGIRAGRLLSPLVAYMKLKNGSIEKL
jgi:DNA-binding HxlR family transcriptional regulator